MKDFRCSDCSGKKECFLAAQLIGLEEYIHKASLLEEGGTPQA